MSVNKSLTFISHNCDRRTSRINKLSEYNYLSYISQTNLHRWTERNHREREIVKRRYWVLENLQGISCRKRKGPSHQSNRLHIGFKSFNGWQNEDLSWIYMTGGILLSGLLPSKITLSNLWGISKKLPHNSTMVMKVAEFPKLALMHGILLSLLI